MERIAQYSQYLYSKEGWDLGLETYFAQSEDFTPVLPANPAHWVEFGGE